MKKERRYLVVLGGTLLFFVLVQILIPRPEIWTATFSSRDKNPFGGYVLDSLLGKIIPGKSVINDNSTIYEINNNFDTHPNILILAGRMKTDSLAAKTLMNMVAQGSNVFIGVNTMEGKLADTLGIQIEQPLGAIVRQRAMLNKKEDSVQLNFVNKALKAPDGYSYNYFDACNYFRAMDSSRARVIATNGAGKPVLVRYPVGEGSLLISSTPLAFTNYYMLWDNNHKFVAKSLSHLPVDDIIWTEYYHLGKMEAQTPLRFILGIPSLKWAFYVAIAGLLLFMVFEAKRKQNIIPVRKPLPNYTMELIQTVTNLFLRESDHKNIARKKIKYFKQHIFHTFRIDLDNPGKGQMEKLAGKTGLNIDHIHDLLNFMGKLAQKSRITADELMELERRLFQFYRSLQ